MFDANAVNQPTTEPESDGYWTREQAEEHMREVLASLPPPPSLEELARAQGVRIPQQLEDLAGGFSEEDFDGFDEFIEQLRYGTLDPKWWLGRPKSDEA